MSHSAPYLFVNIRKGNSQQMPIINLSDLQINYKVPWPINLVVTQESMILYNSVLSFLMKIKQAMFSLQRLSFKGILNFRDVFHLPFLSIPVHYTQSSIVWTLKQVATQDKKECCHLLLFVTDCNYCGLGYFILFPV
jgi:Gamma tubulin complex component C-terminal